MTFDEKLTVCRLRMDGKSVAAIASVIGCSYQSIYNFLRSLPQVQREDHSMPKYDKNRVLELCNDYLAGASVSTLAKVYGMQEREVLDVFSYLAEKRPNRLRHSMYPVLTDWIRMNGYSVKSFAAKLDMTPNRLSRVFSGKGHMRYELAVKIRNFTGLPLSSIYSTVMEADRSPTVSTTPPAKLKKETGKIE